MAAARLGRDCSSANPYPCRARLSPLGWWVGVPRHHQLWHEDPLPPPGPGHTRTRTRTHTHTHTRVHTPLCARRRGGAGWCAAWAAARPRSCCGPWMPGCWPRASPCPARHRPWPCCLGRCCWRAQRPRCTGEWVGEGGSELWVG